MKRLLVFIFILLVILGIGWLLFFSPIFKIKTISIDNQILSEKEILSMIDVKEGDNLLLLNTEDVVTHLEQDPRIESVTTQKKLPSTYQIIINERIPFIKLSAGKDFLTLDQTGRVISLNSEDQLIKIFGCEITSYAIGDYVTTPDEYYLRRSIELASLVHQTDLTLPEIKISKSQLFLYINDEYYVNFGTANNLEKQFSSFMALYQRNLSNGTTSGYINVINPDNIIFKPFQ